MKNPDAPAVRNRRSVRHQLMTPGEKLTASAMNTWPVVPADPLRNGNRHSPADHLHQPDDDQTANVTDPEKREFAQVARLKAAEW
jgi:hypothetical protein